MKAKASSKSAWSKRIGNLVFFLLLAVVLWQRVPAWWSHFNLQGKPAPAFELTREDGVRSPRPWPADRPVALVFWATWCGPCQLELSRLRDSAKNAEIPADRIILISMGEEPALVARVTQERRYPFPSFIDVDGNAAAALQVAATPTVVLLDAKQEVVWVGTGVSPTLIWRLRRHFS